eukprot:CCRYP_018373-RE/>CCRYP_018373-RE protein AED:0.47 eAED:1.00 QI:0/0/0/1/0/0/2/0/118
MAAKHCMLGMFESTTFLRRLLHGGNGSTSFIVRLFIAASSLVSFDAALPAGAPIFADLSARPNANGKSGNMDDGFFAAFRLSLIFGPPAASCSDTAFCGDCELSTCSGRNIDRKQPCT